MKIRDGERETRSLNTRVISLGQNHGKIETTKARGAAAAAAAASDRSSLALREERRRRARPPGPGRRPNGAGGPVPEPRTPVTGGGRTSFFRTTLPSLFRLET
ncbi:unnamed protein product [Sphagnum balticum]